MWKSRLYKKWGCGALVMRLTEFCDGIKLNEKARRQIVDFNMGESEYSEHKRHFESDRHSFFVTITGLENYRPMLLYLFSRFALDVYEEYRIRGISDEIYFDTFSDIRIWSEVCYRDHGEYGIEEYGWLQEHVRLRLFRLGRLQFQPSIFICDLPPEGMSLEKHQIVLNVHIPEGEPMTPYEVDRSFRLARAFFRGIPPIFTCHSWLLYPGLAQIMKPESNILRFQRLFHIYKVDEASREAEQRIFHRVTSEPSQYGEQTSLQRAAKAYLLDGGKLGSASGIRRA